MKRLAMDQVAAAATAASSGVPAGGRRPTKDQPFARAAGVMLVTPHGTALFLRRSGQGDHAGEWCWPGGGLQEGEKAVDAAKRECKEETGLMPPGDPRLVDYSRHEGGEFRTYRCDVPHHRPAKLNSEHTHWKWAPLDDPPQPLHPGVARTLKTMTGDAGAESGASRSLLRRTIKFPPAGASGGRRSIDTSFKRGGAGRILRESPQARHFNQTTHDKGEWDETKHARGKGGKFAKKGAGGGAVVEKPATEKKKTALGRAVHHAKQHVRKHHARVSAHAKEKTKQFIATSKKARKALVDAAKDPEVRKKVTRAGLAAGLVNGVIYGMEMLAGVPAGGVSADPHAKEYVSYVIHNFEDTVGLQAKHGYQVLKKAVKALIGLRRGGKDAALDEENDEVLGTLEHVLEVLESAEQDDGVEDEQRHYAKKHARKTQAGDGDRITFDFATTREKTIDGHLIVHSTCISKANVCPYIGKEIPDFEKLGLEPDKQYQLWRHPDELKKGAATFNGVMLLSKHVPVYAEDYAEQAKPVTVGTIGSDVTFEEPFLRATLRVVDAEAVTKIESGEQKELSCGYHYTPVMESGTTPEGVKYDGIMRDIVGNHVALVKEGRAGPDVVVGDSKGEHMSKKNRLTRQGAVSMLALSAYLRPRLAQDANFSLLPIFAGVTAKNYDEMKPAIITRIQKACRGSLAVDSPVGELAELLDMAKAHQGETEEMDELPEEMEEPIQDIGENFAEPDIMDAEPASELEAFLRDKLSEEDLARAMEMVGGGGEGGDEEEGGGEEKLEDLGAAHDDEENIEEFPPGDEGETEQQHVDQEHEWRRDGMGHQSTDKRRGARDRARHGRAHDRRRVGRDDPPGFQGAPRKGGSMTGDNKNYVSRVEMERSIRAASDATRKTERDIREAERAVQPYVGQLAMTFDSAESVYRRALGIMGVRGCDKIREVSALRTILEMQPKPGAVRERAAGRARAQAQDGKGAGGFLECFPDAGRIGRA